MLLIPIEKLKNERNSFRKAREAHIIRKAKTLQPLSTNKRGEQYFVTIYSTKNFYLFSMISK